MDDQTANLKVNSFTVLGRGFIEKKTKVHPKKQGGTDMEIFHKIASKAKYICGVANELSKDYDTLNHVEQVHLSNMLRVLENLSDDLESYRKFEDVED